MCQGACSEDGSFFFFSSRRRHTRLQGDWSSEVCSSDLGAHRRRLGVTRRHLGRRVERAGVRLPEKVRRHQGRGRAGTPPPLRRDGHRSEEHTSELQSPCNLVCRLLLEKKKNTNNTTHTATALTH